MKRSALAVALFVLAFSACSAKRGSRSAGGAGLSPGAAGAEPPIRGAGFASASGLDDVVFEYDAHFLTEQSRATLKRNAELLKANPSLQLLVEGHCDERGTTEYNLALGQKRARAVREYYAALGIERERVATISYGKERPICREAAEDCHAANRRAEHKTRVILPADAATSKP